MVVVSILLCLVGRWLLGTTQAPPRPALAGLANNERGKQRLKLAVDGSVRLQCQRCLGILDLPVHLAAQLDLASSEAEIMAADDDIERVVAGREMSVAALVEDEVLLALPMAPKHEQCGTAAGL